MAYTRCPLLTIVVVDFPARPVDPHGPRQAILLYLIWVGAAQFGTRVPTDFEEKRPTHRLWVATRQVDPPPLLHIGLPFFSYV